MIPQEFIRKEKNRGPSKGRPFEYVEKEEVSVRESERNSELSN